ncbi:MAG TPA: DoxX family membrane protein [Pyrinomonadaceae bacterium]|jgi:uncharacterized membrane protein YphA (DoxX/SURF4 family)
MKIAVIIVRILLGLLFLFASISVLFNLVPAPELTGNTKIFMDGVNASRFLLPLIKITELLCGLAFVSGYFVPLAVAAIAPIVAGIFLFHVFVDPSGLPVAVALVFAHGFLTYAYRENFKPLLEAKRYA